MQERQGWGVEYIMRIENLRTGKNGSRPRVAATVTWEDCDRPPSEVYFATEEEFEEGLTCNPHAFLVGALLPAMHHRERRIFLDDDICPELRENLITAMHWVRHWYYGPGHPLPSIEARTRTYGEDEGRQGRTGFFFSGGIDCLATLRSNRLSYSRDHPGYLRDGLIIYGQNIESDCRPETFAAARAEFSDLAAESVVVLVPVYTNIRLLDDGKRMFDINHGAILGAVAHAFSRRLKTVCISASDSIPGLRFVQSLIVKPHGSHPLLDPCFSSSDLRIRHDGITMTRLDKTRLVAGWETALRSIKVCGPNWPGENCCRCEKCLRTMLELMAAGVLEKAGAFSVHDVPAEVVARMNIRRPVFGYTVDDDYLELIEPLRVQGRLDLVRAIGQVISRPHHGRGRFARSLREIDRKYLSGALGKTKRLVAPHS